MMTRMTTSTTTIRRRRDIRFRTERDALVELSDFRLVARIENLSVGGAFLKFYRMPKRPSASFRLVLIGKSLSNVMETTVSVVHERGDGWGVQFKEPLKREALIAYLADKGVRRDREGKGWQE